MLLFLGSQAIQFRFQFGNAHARILSHRLLGFNSFTNDSKLKCNRSHIRGVVFFMAESLPSPTDTRDVAQIQKEMETRRLAMLKLMEDSKARLQSLLRANPPPQSDRSTPDKTK